MNLKRDFGFNPATGCAAILLAFLLAACGGGGSGSSPAAGGGSSATISGSVFAGPVAGAQVTVKAADGAIVAGPVATGAAGEYQISVPTGALAEDLRIEATGGSFTDEATGETTVAGRLAAFVEAGSHAAGGSVHLAPASTIVDEMVAAGLTATDAKAAFSAAFGFTPDSGVAPKAAPAAGIEEAQLLAGLRAAAFSQMAKEMGLTPAEQFDLIAQIGRDLADGTLDGAHGAEPTPLAGADVANRFECSLAALLADPVANQTGLTADKVGILPFAKVAFTQTYRVDYLPGMMPATQGKTQFRIKVVRRNDGAPVTGLSLALMPMMHMAAHAHATPVDEAVVDNGDGTYSCNVYYLMASSMNGMSMGFWELKVLIDEETATFFPGVGMAMGSDTIRAVLKGQADTTAGMMGPAKRSYYLFKDGGVVGTPGDHTLRLFLATQESMLSYPAVMQGTLLHDAQNAEWSVETLTLEASTDGGSTWVEGDHIDGGHWEVPGLVSGQAGEVRVRLAVNGEQKTTDGMAPAGANDYAVFAVTP
jgi:hypothetical protein